MDRLDVLAAGLLPAWVGAGQSVVLAGWFEVAAGRLLGHELVCCLKPSLGPTEPAAAQEGDRVRFGTAHSLQGPVHAAMGDDQQPLALAVLDDGGPGQRGSSRGSRTARLARPKPTPEAVLVVDYPMVR
jgi:hypothetical protein